MPDTLPPQLITRSVTRAVEDAFVMLLQQELLLVGTDIVAASNRDAVAQPTHVFVFCDQAVPRLPGGTIYSANVAVAAVTHLDDNTDAERQALVALVAGVMGRHPQEFYHEDLIVKGWTILAQGETSDGRQMADVFRLRVAVHGADGIPVSG